MSIKCLMNGLEVNYPCSPTCALFGDCVTAFEKQKKASVRTNADRIRAMSDEELADWIARTQMGAIKDAMNLLRLPCDATDGVVELGKTEALEWLQQPAEGE